MKLHFGAFDASIIAVEIKDPHSSCACLRGSALASFTLPIEFRV